MVDSIGSPNSFSNCHCNFLPKQSHHIVGFDIVFWLLLIFAKNVVLFWLLLTFVFYFFHFCPFLLLLILVLLLLLLLLFVFICFGFFFFTPLHLLVFVLFFFIWWMKCLSTHNFLIKIFYHFFYSNTGMQINFRKIHFSSLFFFSIKREKEFIFPQLFNQETK